MRILLDDNVAIALGFAGASNKSSSRQLRNKFDALHRRSVAPKRTTKAVCLAANRKQNLVEASRNPLVCFLNCLRASEHDGCWSCGICVPRHACGGVSEVLELFSVDHTEDRKGVVQCSGWGFKAMCIHGSKLQRRLVLFCLEARSTGLFSVSGNGVAFAECQFFQILC